MGQIQCLQEKLFFELGPARDGGGSIGAGKYRHHRHDDDTHQRVFEIDAGAWIIQLIKVADDFVQANVLHFGHRSSSMGKYNGMPLRRLV